MGGVGLVVRRRRPLVRAVHPDLRSPLLYVPTALTSRRALPAARRLLGRASPIEEGVEVRTEHVPAGADGPGVRVLVYEPSARDLPSGALLWLHGGGFVMGVPEQNHTWCSAVARALGVLVVNVDYRLAPEHPFPAALDDSIAALRWVHEYAERLGVDPARIAIGGDSAGGGLAASLAQRARDEGGPAIACQLLVYPMLDDRTVERAAETGLDALLWPAASNRFAWDAYLGGRSPGIDPPEHAAPGRTDDLAGLPPTWIGVGDIDLFHGEDVDYAERLVAAGVPCRLRVEPGLFHAADALVPGSAVTRAFRADALDVLADAIG